MNKTFETAELNLRKQ